MQRLLPSPGETRRSRFQGAHAIRFSLFNTALLMGAVPAGAAPPARPRPARSAPKPKAPAPRPPAEDPLEGPLPGSGTRRIDIPRPRPITMPGTGIDRTTTDPRRPTMAQLDATDPQRGEARALALATLRAAGGPARVARMAAADVGTRSDEAARVLAKHTNPDGLRRLALHTDPQVRVGVARALAYRPEAANTLLGELLGDWSLKVVRAALHTAARIGTAPVLGRLATAVLRYDRSVRASALSVLAQHEALAVAKNAVIAAATHPSPTIREDAVVAIGLSRAAWARPYLERLVRDPSPELRRAVARSLGRLPPSPSAFRVLGLLAQDRISDVRREASRARAELQRAQRAVRSRSAKTRGRR